MHDLASSSPAHWRYVSEGGANAVFRYVGHSPSPLFSGKVLRLRKTSSHPEKMSSAPEIDESARFLEAVIQPLLGQDLLPQQAPIALHKDFLSDLNASSIHLRPVWRVKMGGLDEERTEGLLVDDLIGPASSPGRRVLAVEIKPKWGFLPSPNHLSPETEPIKTTFCRTCMHRHFKASSSASQPSTLSFCPLDLFSGERGRMGRAVQALWDGWVADGGTGNSLRFFVDGKVILPSEPQSLLALFPGLPRSELPSLVTRIVSDTLLSSPVLPRLSALQATLDPLDIEGLLALPSLSPLPSHLPSPTMDECSAFVQLYLSEPESTQASWTDREHVLAFLLSATFKDCSIIARIPFDLEPFPLDQSARATAAAASVRVIDLDPKPVARLQKWSDLDREIVRTWAAWLAADGRETKRCSS